MQNLTRKADRKHVHWNSSAIQSMPIRHCHPHASNIVRNLMGPKCFHRSESRNKTCKPDFSLKFLPQAANCLRAKAGNNAQPPPSMAMPGILGGVTAATATMWGRNSSWKSLLFVALCASKRAAGVHLLTVAADFLKLSSSAGWKTPSQL